MNSRNKSLLIGLASLCILWKLFDYYKVQKVALSERESFAAREKEVAEQKIRHDIVTVTVYYETLCSDSRSFILKQLLPTYLQLPSYINLDFVPYGKATTIVKPNGKIDFKCQHGEIECLGNKVHACTLNSVADQRIQLQMIACMIEDNIIPLDSCERCARRNNVNYDVIADCTNSPRSAELLKEYGNRTHKVHPTFIPTIEFNGALKVPLSEILKNFKKQLCIQITDKPKECRI